MNNILNSGMDLNLFHPFITNSGIVASLPAFMSVWVDGSVRDPPVLVLYTLGRTALNRSRSARLQRGSRVLPRQADPIQPLHLSPVCGRRILVPETRPER